MEKINKQTILCIGIFLMSFCWGCSAHVNLGMNNDGKIIGTDAGGRQSPGEYFAMKVEQEKTEVLILLYNKLEEAYQKKKTDDVEEILKEINRVKYGETPKGYVRLGAKNVSDHKVTITSKPFSGITLPPGTSTPEELHGLIKEKEFYRLQLKACEDESCNKFANLLVDIYIDPGRKRPITIRNN